MVDLAAVFGRFAESYLATHGAAMPPSQRRAIADILACRTAALGGQLWRCDRCGTEVPVFHSCRNRSCSQCHGSQTEAWLAQRRTELLPVPHFHVTVTVPAELRGVLRQHQRDGCGALMTAVGTAILDLARDPQWVGGTPGVLAVFHSWTQQLHYHPHVHCLVTGGGLSGDGHTWHPARKAFLFPTKALAKLVRGRFRAALEARCPDLSLPPEVWRKPWVVHITPWGDDPDAVLQYLARYVFRIAITNRRIVALDQNTVTFRYKDRRTGKHRLCTLPGHEFMRRYLQHVLPKGFHKVRYFGLWHPAKRAERQRLAHALLLQQPAAPTVEPAPEPEHAADTSAPDEPRPCPLCRHGKLVIFRRRFLPCWAMAP